jgi:hypothetical protein
MQNPTSKIQDGAGSVLQANGDQRAGIPRHSFPVYDENGDIPFSDNADRRGSDEEIANPPSPVASDDDEIICCRSGVSNDFDIGLAIHYPWCDKQLEVPGYLRCLGSRRCLLLEFEPGSLLDSAAHRARHLIRQNMEQFKRCSLSQWQLNSPRDRIFRIAGKIRRHQDGSEFPALLIVAHCVVPSNSAADWPASRLQPLHSDGEEACELRGQKPLLCQYSWC